jgi:hypothetical protein
MPRDSVLQVARDNPRFVAWALWDSMFANYAERLDH